MTSLQPFHTSLEMMTGANMNTNDIFTATSYQPKNDDRSKPMNTNDIFTVVSHQPKNDGRSSMNTNDIFIATSYQLKNDDRNIHEYQ